jgi:ATP-dependent DNA helicase RecG
VSRLPFRYEDNRVFDQIGRLQAGQRAFVRGRLGSVRKRRARRYLILETFVLDETGRIPVVWFNQPYLEQRLKVGAEIMLRGLVRVSRMRRNDVVLMSPRIESATHGNDLELRTISAVYERLGGVSGKTLKALIAQALGELGEDSATEILPAAIRGRLGIMRRDDALRAIHQPSENADIDELNESRSPAHHSLILEELFLFQLGLAARRRRAERSFKHRRCEVNESVSDVVRSVLPFTLTEAQRRVSMEIAEDMQSARPMRRLLQGDVGSGKTVLALMAVVIAVENGRQAALMAPTELLAEQHFATFQRLLARRPYGMALLTARVKGRERETALKGLASGNMSIVIGTHALIQESVTFHELGLIVIDEQHRFGVLERDELARKDWRADLLVMTATPIPRTLALTSYGDLDVSRIDELPPGRTPIQTVHLHAATKEEMLACVASELNAGRQAYVVYPLVEDVETYEDLRAVTTMAREWARALPEHRVATLHGQMTSVEKEHVMREYLSGQIDVLVTTSIIEVGIDVPNATLIVIEHAERFGLAQLHQLRGRIGRGRYSSRCVLVTRGRLSIAARKRMGIITSTQDGFVIAERDLELRGPGDIVGVRQWGLPRLRFADLVRDRTLLEQARQAAFEYAEQTAHDPSAEALRDFIEKGGWEGRFGLSRIA